MEKNKQGLRRTILLFIGLLLFLILLDQGIKLIVDAAYSFDGDPMQVHDCIHLHPRVNSKNVMPLIELSERTSLPFSLFMALKTLGDLLKIALVFVFVYGMHRWVVLAKIKTLPKLRFSFLLLSCAGGLCSIIDDLCWGGSLDYFCFSWSSDASGTMRCYHLTQDLKDFYLDCMLVMFFILLIYILSHLGNAEKIKETGRKFVTEQKTRLRSIFCEKNSQKGNDHEK